MAGLRFIPGNISRRRDDCEAGRKWAMVPAVVAVIFEHPSGSKAVVGQGGGVGVEVRLTLRRSAKSPKHVAPPSTNPNNATRKTKAEARSFAISDDRIKVLKASPDYAQMSHLSQHS